jgi:hypothetical protein
MFKFPEKLYLFDIYSMTIDVYILQEKNVFLLSRIKDEKRTYRSNTGAAFLLSEENFEEDIFRLSLPPARLTLEEAQEDGINYLNNRLKKAEEEVEFLKNHNRKFKIIE